MVGLVAMTVLVSPAKAAPHGCLDRAEQRAAVIAHKAVPLAAAIKSLRVHDRRAEVVRAELCRRGDGLVYVLTLLAHNGKVTRAVVDADKDKPVAGR